MADPVLCDEILVTLEERGAVTVDRPGEFKEKAGINPAWSKNQVKKALGSLIDRKLVVRHRPPQQSCSDPGQPITFRPRVA